MLSKAPGFGSESGTLNIARVPSEATRLARFSGLFVAVSVLPFVIGADSLVGSAFVLAVGAGIALLYVTVRSRQLSAV